MSCSRPNALRSLLIMITRGVGLAGRLGLTLYMARFLPLDQVGVFGLIMGVSVLMPPLSGLGLNFYMGRELVGLDGFEAGKLIRDRLLVTALTMSFFVVFSIALSLITIPSHLALVFLIDFIVFFDTIATDLILCMLYIRRPLLSNALLFIKSTLWIFPVAASGIMFPTTRNLEFILVAWSTGLLIYFMAAAFALRSWPISAIVRTSVDWHGMKMLIARGWMIYLNDLGAAAILYLNRYVISGILGLHAAGVFTLIWSITNGLNVLISTGVNQTSTPYLVAEFKISEHSWRALLAKQLIHIVAICIPLSLVVFFATAFILPRIGVSKLIGNSLLIALMLLGTTLRLLADMLQSALYSRHLDRELALINISFIGVGLVCDIGLIGMLGLKGAGLSIIITNLLLIGTRLFILHRRGSSIFDLALTIFSTVRTSKASLFSRTLTVGRRA